MQKRLRAEKEVAEVLRGERGRGESTQATVPYSPGDAAVAGRPGWIHVWLHGDPDSEIEVFNPSTSIASGIVVDLERVFVPGASYYRVRGIAANIWYGDSFGYSQFYASGITGNVGSHAAQHQRRDLGAGGFDPLDVYTRMLMPLRAQAQATPDLTVYVVEGYYSINTFKHWSGGSSPAFTLPTFGSPSRYDLLYIGNDDALHIASGDAAAWGATPTFPSVPAGSVPVAFVYLTNSTTTITESNIIDARIILTANTSASGTGDASADAAYVLASPFSGLPSGVVVASGLSMRGPFGARPVSTAVAGAFYFVTGTGAQRLTRWTGAAWEDVVDNNVLQTGVVRGNRHRLNFSGSGVSVWDDAANDYLNIQIGENAAGGDLSGTYPDPSVAKIQGRAVSSSAPSSGDALAWNGSQWMPSGIAAGGGGGGGAAAYGQILTYPTTFSGDSISGASTTPFVDVSAFDTKESLNARILHLVTKGASKDQRVRVTLNTTKAGAFDVSVCIAVNGLYWSARNDTYAEVRLSTSGDSQIAIARIYTDNAGGGSGYYINQCEVRVGGSALTSASANIEPTCPIGETITLRFVRDGANIISFYVGFGTAPMALMQITNGSVQPYTTTVSGTLERVEIAQHTPSGPTSTSQIECFVDYVVSL